MNVLKHIETYVTFTLSLSLSLSHDFDLSVYKSSRYIMIHTYIIKVSIINMCIYVLFQHLNNWMVDARTSS